MIPISRERVRALLRHTAVKNIVMLYGVQIGTYVFPLITLPYLSRVLSPEKFGLIAFAQSFVWYFNTLTEYGFNLTATRRVAIRKEDPAAVSSIFSSVMAAKTLLTVAGFVMMLAVVFSVPRLRMNWPLFPIAFMTVVGGWLFPMWLYQGLEKLGHVAARDFISKMLATALVFLVVRRESDYLLAAGIQSGATVIAGVISLALAPRVCHVRFLRPSWQETYGVLREGWPVFLSMVALSLTAATNIFILGLIVSAAQVGYYMAAFRLVVALRMLVGPIVTAVYPHVSHMAAKSPADAVRFLRKYTWILAAPFLAISLVLLVFAPLITRILFGPLYGPTVPLMRIMSPSPFLLAVAHTYTTYYMLAFGYEKEWSRLVMVATALNYVLMAGMLWTMEPTLAITIIGTITDVFTVAAAYWFHRRTAESRKTPAVAAP